MSRASTQEPLQLPESLHRRLADFRRRVWSIKLIEIFCATLFGVIAAFLVLFAVDRLCDTAPAVRWALFAAALVGCACVPTALYRWIWRTRRHEQLAGLVSLHDRRAGDQLLGVIELVHNPAEQARSRSLCEAAVRQAADDAARRDFRDAVPAPRHQLWAGLFSLATIIAAGLTAFTPGAAANAWSRFLAPWADIPRFTFAAIHPLSERLAVPHGEPFTVAVRLDDDSPWRPARGKVQIVCQAAVEGVLQDGRYQFSLPGQIEPGRLALRIGDAAQEVQVVPVLRPELRAAEVEASLPAYLGRAQPLKKDLRGGTVSLVKGSRALVVATTNRGLTNAWVDHERTPPVFDTVTSRVVEVTGPRKLVFKWQDEFGLTGREPFTASLASRDDEPPSLACEDLPRQKVVLDSEVLNFKVSARDDFGVRRIGLEWRGAESPLIKTPARGEKMLAAGGHERESLEVAGTFSAQAQGIEPQTLTLRVFVEDYFPQRERVYSPTYTLFVLSPEQHAIWLTEQLGKWHRLSLEVRDREMHLHETNKQLRELAASDREPSDLRRRIEAQANAERSNGRRLSGLVAAGEDLVRQAMRNPEFGVGHLEKWAEMLQILKDISAHRMPSVADLLKEAAQARGIAQLATRPAPSAGQVRDLPGGAGAGAKPAPQPPRPAVPQVADRESSQQPGDKNPPPLAAGGSKPPAPRLTLPETTLTGRPPRKAPPPAAAKMDAAVTAQQDLLAEFEKIAAELDRVLANLEGSTLVKRLKAAARQQYRISGRLGDQVQAAFGVAAARVPAAAFQVLGDLAEQEEQGSQAVSILMDDMQAYFDRRRFMKIKTVLDDMRKEDVIGGLRQLGEELRRENGLAMAQCEFWSDALDRWAEDLVDPACCGSCPGSKSKGSLPPSIVLEVLQILEGEVNLREETRVAEQARPAIEAAEHHQAAEKLADTQRTLDERVRKVVERILQLPDAETEFAYELALLGQVSAVMRDASEILAQPETGAPAIAAETEAIELLLRSRRINPKAGGGGGPTPGGGGGGTTLDSALALLGRGVNEQEVREDHGISQTTGNTGPGLPEEFRPGLDEYFNQLERSGDPKPGRGGNAN